MSAWKNLRCRTYLGGECWSACQMAASGRCAWWEHALPSERCHTESMHSDFSLSLWVMAIIAWYVCTDVFHFWVVSDSGTQKPCVRDACNKQVIAHIFAVVHNKRDVRAFKSYACLRLWGYVKSASSWLSRWKCSPVVPCQADQNGAVNLTYMCNGALEAFQHHFHDHFCNHDCLMHHNCWRRGAR
jgi:hypothetical protein